jgi:hypothetical protein
MHGLKNIETKCLAEAAKLFIGVWCIRNTDISFICKDRAGEAVVVQVAGHFAERHFAERHFAERHFAERHFAERTFCRRTFCRTDVLPNGYFAEWTLYRTDSLTNGHFAEN